MLSTLIMKGYLDLQVNIENASNLKATQPAAKTILLKNVNYILEDIQEEGDNIKSYSSK